MKDKAGIFETLHAKIEEYGKESLDVYRLKAAGSSSEIASAVVFYLTVICCRLSAVVVTDRAIALWLGQILGASFYGFLCVAAFNAPPGCFKFIIADPDSVADRSHSLIKKMQY